MSGYFYIKSVLNGLVLDVQGGGYASPGTPVIMWPQKQQDNDNQLFSEDHSTGTIRSKASQMCLEVQGDRLVVNHFYAGNQNQQWLFSGKTIQNRYQRHQVLDIAGANSSPGARVCAYNNNNQANQMWVKKWVKKRVQHTYPTSPEHSMAGPACFYAKSPMNGLVLDAEHGGRHPGTRLIMWNQKRWLDTDNQLFYVDHMTSTIRSKASNLCIESKGGRIILNNHIPGNSSQQWILSGDQIVMKFSPSTVLDIANENCSPGASLCAWPSNGQSNQRWMIEYV